MNHPSTLDGLFALDLYLLIFLVPLLIGGLIQEQLWPRLRRLWRATVGRLAAHAAARKMTYLPTRPPSP